MNAPVGRLFPLVHLYFFLNKTKEEMIMRHFSGDLEKQENRRSRQLSNKKLWNGELPEFFVV